jgi:hypothetical protein
MRTTIGGAVTLAFPAVFGSVGRSLERRQGSVRQTFDRLEHVGHQSAAQRQAHDRGADQHDGVEHDSDDGLDQQGDGRIHVIIVSNERPESHGGGCRLAGGANPTSDVAAPV